MIATKFCIVAIGLSPDKLQTEASLNGEIASSSVEQMTGIQQISMAMNQLDQASQLNASAAQEISANVTTIAQNSEQVDIEILALNKLIAG